MNDITKWPEALGDPLQAGYNYTIGAARNVSNAVGASRTRTTSKAHNTTFNTAYLFTDDQLKRFQSFCNDEIDYMQKWFKQRLLLGADLIEQTVRIISVQPFRREKTFWRVSLTLECPDRFVIDDETAGTIIKWGGSEIERIFKAADNYYYAINWVMPYGGAEFNKILIASDTYYKTINYLIPKIYEV